MQYYMLHVSHRLWWIGKLTSKQSHSSTLCTLSLRMYSAVLRVSLGTLQRRYITTITSSVTTEFRDEEEAQLFWLVSGTAGGGRAAEDFLDSADCSFLVSALVARPREPLACTASLLQRGHG